MTLLDTLNFVAFNPLANNNPITVRRRKLMAKIDEQIQLATNKDYTPMQHKWVTDEQGKQTKVEVAKRVKHWWTASVDGKINLLVRYGSKPLEFAKGKNAIELASEAEVEDALSKREAPDIAVDLYDIGLTDWQGSQDPRRKPIKKYINALMNDEKGTFRLDKDSLALICLSQKQLKDKVLDAHAPIADKLVAGIGLNTQYIDSQIAEDVMHTLIHQGIVVLPIHDSFIIRTGYKQYLENAMQKAFNKLTGANISVDADEPRLPTHFGLSKEKMLAEGQSLKNNPSSFVTNLADSKLSELIQDSIMSSYIQGWEQWRSGS